MILNLPWKNVCWLKNYHIKIYKYNLNTHKLENIIRGSHHQVQLVNQLNLHEYCHIHQYFK